jgi:phytoene synthase
VSATATSIEQAYARCEAITRTQAANFYYGIRLLPRERRRAMCAVYAFARRVDDIGDGPLPREQKLRLLDAQARALAAIEPARVLGAGEAAGTRGTARAGTRGAARAGMDGGAGAGGDDPVAIALADASTRFALSAGALVEMIEGVWMDVQDVTYETFAELVPYCRRVAGAIGRECLAIFGLRDDAGTRAQAEALANDLGVALQLTNILRDVREDARNGRVYLPREDLRRFELIASPGDGAPEALAAIARATGVSSANGEQAGGEELQRLAALVRFQAARAREWFDRGLTLVPLLDRRSAGCVLAMAGIYRRLLDRIERHPERIARERMSLPKHEKAWVAARGLLGVSD